MLYQPLDPKERTVSGGQTRSYVPADEFAVNKEDSEMCLWQLDVGI